MGVTDACVDDAGFAGGDAHDEADGHEDEAEEDEGRALALPVGEEGDEDAEDGGCEVDGDGEQLRG